jgi:hypothetical protein
MKRIKKIESEILSQMISNENVFSLFSQGLKKNIKKIGKTTVISLLALSSLGMSPMAQAGDRVGDNSLSLMLLASGLSGIFSNNDRPNGIPIDCNVEGLNGWAVGGAAAAGSFVGNQFGRGYGRAASTVGLGLLSDAYVRSTETKKMKEECLFQEGQYVKLLQDYYVPNYRFNPNLQGPYIIYQTQNQFGQSFVVSSTDSPAVSFFQGKLKATKNLSTNNYAEKRLEERWLNLENAYQELDKVSQQYVQAQKNNQVSSATYNTQDVLYADANQFQKYYSNYSLARALFYATADECVLHGYNIEQYKQALDYMTPPKSAYLSFNGKLGDRYPTISYQMR